MRHNTLVFYQTETIVYLAVSFFAMEYAHTSSLLLLWSMRTPVRILTVNNEETKKIFFHIAVRLQFTFPGVISLPFYNYAFKTFSFDTRQSMSRL